MEFDLLIVAQRIVVNFWPSWGIFAEDTIEDGWHGHAPNRFFLCFLYFFRELWATGSAAAVVGLLAATFGVWNHIGKEKTTSIERNWGKNFTVSRFVRRLSVLAILSRDSAATRRYFSQSFWPRLHGFLFPDFFGRFGGFLPEITHECGRDKGCMYGMLAKFAFFRLPGRKLLSKVVSLLLPTHKFDCPTCPASPIFFLSLFFPFFPVLSYILLPLSVCFPPLFFLPLFGPCLLVFPTTSICTIFRPTLLFWLIFLFWHLWC